MPGFQPSGNARIFSNVSANAGTFNSIRSGNTKRGDLVIQNLNYADQPSKSSYEIGSTDIPAWKQVQDFVTDKQQGLLPKRACTYATDGALCNATRELYNGTNNASQQALLQAKKLSPAMTNSDLAALTSQVTCSPVVCPLYRLVVAGDLWVDGAKLAAGDRVLVKDGIGGTPASLSYRKDDVTSLHWKNREGDGSTYMYFGSGVTLESSNLPTYFPGCVYSEEDTLVSYDKNLVTANQVDSDAKSDFRVFLDGLNLVLQARDGSYDMLFQPINGGPVLGSELLNGTGQSGRPWSVDGPRDIVVYCNVNPGYTTPRNLEAVDPMLGNGIYEWNAPYLTYAPDAGPSWQSSAINFLGEVTEYVMQDNSAKGAYTVTLKGFTNYGSAWVVAYKTGMPYDSQNSGDLNALYYVDPSQKQDYALFSTHGGGDLMGPTSSKANGVAYFTDGLGRQTAASNYMILHSDKVEFSNTMRLECNSQSISLGTSSFVVNSTATTVNGSLSVTGALGLTTSSLTASAGVTVSGGGLTVSVGGGNTSLQAATANGLLTAVNGLRVSGGVTVSAGGVTVSAGGVTVSAGGADISGDSKVTGTMEVTKLTVSSGGADISGDSKVTGTMEVTQLLTADLGVTVSAGGVTVDAGGADITGNSKVTGTLEVTQALSVQGALQFKVYSPLLKWRASGSITFGSNFPDRMWQSDHPSQAHYAPYEIDLGDMKDANYIELVNSTSKSTPMPFDPNATDVWVIATFEDPSPALSTVHRVQYINAILDGATASTKHASVALYRRLSGSLVHVMDIMYEDSSEFVYCVTLGKWYDR